MSGIRGYEYEDPDDGRMIASTALLWENAGQSISVPPALSGTTVLAVGGLGRLKLPAPSMVSIQLAETAYIPASRMVLGDMIFAKVDWQVGSGVYTAFVDVMRGTAFTLAAAEAVTITGIASCAGGFATTQANFQCVMAPSSAINPIPASWTQSYTLVGGVRTQIATSTVLGPFVIPAFPLFARSIQVFSSIVNNSSAVQVELVDVTGTTVVNEVSTRDNPIQLGGIPYANVFLTSPVNATVLLRWELSL